MVWGDNGFYTIFLVLKDYIEIVSMLTYSIAIDLRNFFRSIDVYFNSILLFLLNIKLNISREYKLKFILKSGFEGD